MNDFKIPLRGAHNPSSQQAGTTPGSFANAADIGRLVQEPNPSSVVAGSTDMGNVSYAVPAIHPMIKVAPEGTAIHTPDFATHARSEAGDRAVIDGALSMALTIVDLWANTETMGSVRGAFEESK